MIRADAPGDYQEAGGLITADLDQDGQKDFVLTQPGYIGAYSSLGQRLWSEKIDIQVTRQSERLGLPGLHGPGVQAADVDGDGKVEVLFLTQDNTLHVVEGSTGAIRKRISVQAPVGTARWEHLVIANFRGLGDRDLLLQATNARGYRMGRFLAAYALEQLLHHETPQPLWSRDDFVANAHNGARVADLDGDGRDEVLGATIVSPDGNRLFQIPLRGHIDSLFVADVRPDVPGLEVVALEEGGNRRLLPDWNRAFRLVNRAFDHVWGNGNRIFLYNQERLLWVTHYRHREPQNAAVGDFDPSRPGLEIWCRSRFDRHQKPFVFDARGQLISTYEMDRVAPAGWTDRGVEVIFAIHWTGRQKRLAAAKERARQGDVAIFDPVSGTFLQHFKEQAARLYVADVSGDWREEVIVLNGKELHIYENPEANPNPDLLSLWTSNPYRRSKMTWNYYSP